jgi:hypothetical protein
VACDGPPMWDEYVGLAASSAMMFSWRIEKESFHRRGDDLHHLASHPYFSLTGMTAFVAWILICSCQGFAGEAVGAD